MTVTGIIGVPTTDTARHSAFYEQLLRLQRPANTSFSIIRGASVAENRNKTLASAKEHNAEWVFFLDDDMIPPPELLMHLLSRPAVPVLSALYVSRVTPFIPLAFHRAEENGAAFKSVLRPGDAGCVEVAAVGAGAMLIRRIVWDTLPHPWFTLGQIAPDAWGDDLHFCKKVRDAGLSVWVDYDTSIGHLGVMGMWPAYTALDDTTREWHSDLMQNGVRYRLPAATEADLVSMPTQSGGIA